MKKQGIESFSGDEIEDQEITTRRFIHLYREKPAKHDIMASDDESGAAIYDGSRWRKFNLRQLIQRVSTPDIDEP